MANRFSRRRFLASSASTAAGLALAGAVPAWAQQPGAAAGASARKLRVGLVGVGNRGFAHVREVSKIPNAEVVALCDVDTGMLAAAAKVIPGAKHFADFRKMLKLPGLEAVLVATPDHTHAVASAAALRAGKHVYCEKPLAHTVQEVRTITELAGETDLVTQLGIQIHSMDNYRRVVELIRAGTIGKVSEVHIWHSRGNQPFDATPVDPPASLDYDLWLGPVPERQYLASFHPYNWRRWWAFGSGILGDIGCHFMDIAFWALDLRYPTRVEASGPEVSLENTDIGIVAKYDFPARGDQPAVQLTWHDPPHVPDIRNQLGLDDKMLSEGVLFIGSDGMIFTSYRRHFLLPQEKFKAFQAPAPTIASSPGHQQEWINACLKGDPAAASCPFSYGGPLSETALLGTVAFRAGKALEWDGKSMRIPNAPEAEKFLAEPRRPGWEL